MAIPSLRKVFPFAATDIQTFYFDVSGVSRQILYNELEITLSSDTSQILYKERVQEFRYQHTLPINTLTNGNQYAATIRVYDSNQVLIGKSNPIFFYCFSAISLTIPTIINGEVGNQSVTFKGEYYQAEDEIVESYRFVLYDDNQIEITRSPDLYDGLFSYEFSGLRNREKYYIELKVVTTNELIGTSGLIEFTARYIAPRFSSSLQLENLKEEASIYVKCNIIRIVGIPDTTPVIYTPEGEINLINNGVWFDEGFRIQGNFTLQMWVSNISEVDDYFFKLVANDGSNLRLYYKENKINLLKMSDETFVVQRLLGETLVEAPEDKLFICVKHIDGLYDFNYGKVVE